MSRNLKRNIKISNSAHKKLKIFVASGGYETISDAIETLLDDINSGKVIKKEEVNA